MNWMVLWWKVVSFPNVLVNIVNAGDHETRSRVSSILPFGMNVQRHWSCSAITICSDLWDYGTAELWNCGTVTNGELNLPSLY